MVMAVIPPRNWRALTLTSAVVGITVTGALLGALISDLKRTKELEMEAETVWQDFPEQLHNSRLFRSIALLLDVLSIPVIFKRRRIPRN